LVATESERVTAAIVPTDAIARAAERRWGVARLEALVSAQTLLRWREGWQIYATAVRHADVDTVERLAPKIAQAIRAMEAEAEAAGHQHLAPDAWEAPLADGRVLVVCRSFAEAHALVAASRAQHGHGGAEGGEGPPEAGMRERVVWTMEELAAVLPTLEITYQAKLSFPGARVSSSVIRSESFAHDWATDDMPELHDAPGREVA
jgi:hypothetical protein